MSFKVHEPSPGIFVYHVDTALTKIDTVKLLREIENSLRNGKSKLIIELSAAAATGSHGYGYLEKAFRGVRALAQKLHGDIKYILPKKISDRVAGTLFDIKIAINALATVPSAEDIREEHVKLREQLIFQEVQVKKLTEEVRLLTLKTKELASLVNQPQSDKELRAAIDHYRKLACEVQMDTPTYREDLSRK